MPWISVLVVAFLVLGLRSSVPERSARLLTLILTLVVLTGVFLQKGSGA
jgi:hypothetical protein